MIAEVSCVQLLNFINVVAIFGPSFIALVHTKQKKLKKDVRF